MEKMHVFLFKQKLIVFIFFLVQAQSMFGQTFTWNSFTAGTLAPSTYSTSSGSCNMTASVTGSNFTTSTTNGLRFHTISGGTGLYIDNDWSNLTTTTVVTLTFSPAIVNPSFSIFDINRTGPCNDISTNQWVDRVIVQPNTGTVSATGSSTYQTITGSGTGTCTVVPNLVCNATNTDNQVNFSINGTISTLTITYGSGSDVSRAASFVGCTIPTPASCLTGRLAVTNPRSQFILIGSISGQTVSAPSAITGGSSTICAGSSATLTATGGNANTRWYTGSCGGTQIGTGASITVNPTSTTTYFAANVNCGTITSCAQVTVNVVNPPTVTSTIPASRCGSGSLVLGASASSGTISWFTNSSGGISFHTGTSYTTPVLTSSTTYYVEASTGSCVSATRTPITATINYPNSSGLASGEWLWTGIVSNLWQTPGNWLVFNGVAFNNPTVPPSHLDNVRIRQNGTCILNQPTIDGTSTAVGPSPNTVASNSNDCQNIVIEAGAVLSFENGLNRHLHVNGNYTNQGTLNYNDGRVKFIRNGTQSITDANGEAVFYQMNVGGNSLTTLNNNVRVLHEVRLNGVIQTNANRFYMNTPISGHLVNFGGHVFGNFRRDIVTNTDVYKFPMGVSTSLAAHPSGGRRLLEFLNNNISGVSYLDCSVSNTFKSGGVQNDPSLDPAKAIQAGQIMDFVHPEGQWRLTPNSPVTSGNYGVRLYVQNFGSLDASKDNKFIVLKRQDNSSTFFDFNSFESSTSIPAPSSAGRIFDNALGYAERTGFTGFSEFIIASNPTPLPVKLNSFEVRCDLSDNVISWSTMNERNNDYFTVEYSPTAINFSPIAFIPGSINSNSLISYEINHTPSFRGNHYYRLYQTDLDGSKEFLAEKVVNNVSCSDKTDQIVVFSNGENVQIQFNVSEKTKINYVLYDGIGKLVYNSGESFVNESNSVHSIPLTNFASGIYFVHLEINNQIMIYKISL